MTKANNILVTWIFAICWNKTFPILRVLCASLIAIENDLSHSYTVEKTSRLAFARISKNAPKSALFIIFMHKPHISWMRNVIVTIKWAIQFVAMQTTGLKFMPVMQRNSRNDVPLFLLCSLTLPFVLSILICIMCCLLKNSWKTYILTFLNGLGHAPVII